MQLIEGVGNEVSVFFICVTGLLGIFIYKLISQFSFSLPRSDPSSSNLSDNVFTSNDVSDDSFYSLHLNIHHVLK